MKCTRTHLIDRRSGELAIVLMRIKLRAVVRVKFWIVNLAWFWRVPFFFVDDKSASWGIQYSAWTTSGIQKQNNRLSVWSSAVVQRVLFDYYVRILTSPSCFVHWYPAIVLATIQLAECCRRCNALVFLARSVFIFSALFFAFALPQPKSLNWKSVLMVAAMLCHILTRECVAIIYGYGIWKATQRVKRNNDVGH